MMKIFILMTIMYLSLIMTFLNHPLSMGFMILIQTMMICLISGMLINTYWFSYILFLTFLGGLLVLFIYVCSIASNEMFKFSMNMKKSIMMFILMMMMTQIWMYNKLNWLNMNINKEMNNFFNLFFMNMENNINMNKLYNNHNYYMTMLMIIYLFITLISVVKITNIKYGPLRST
uniref:NADH-ubiquinone oxidoreductase chain 6 n=1 Tax=Acropteris iphiata TaxID=2669307 RepID=A0A7T8V7U4_9NEOP|nr:NADH dehydrogenase subunit 6 [Acropteris iphiata]QQQ89081.1 NADH dehydrogenase subunit 6 [Acropteris iphiata]